MKTLFILFLLAISPLFATYLFLGEEKLGSEQKEQLFSLLLQGEAPRVFYEENPIDLQAECSKLFPSLQLEWIPSSLWQLGALHAFFHDPVIRNSILSRSASLWD